MEVVPPRMLCPLLLRLCLGFPPASCDCLDPDRCLHVQVCTSEEHEQGLDLATSESRLHGHARPSCLLHELPDPSSWA